MASLKPSVSTVASAGLGVPAAVILSWGLSLSGVDVPGPVEAAFGVLIGAVVGFFFHGGTSDTTV